MKIVHEIPHDGASRRIERLNLYSLVEEVRQILRTVKIRLKEEGHANSGVVLRKLLDSGFKRGDGWFRRTSGGSGWKKCIEIEEGKVCVEVEIRVSGRSDIVVVGLYHLQRSIEAGQVDLGILIVPSDTLSPFLKSKQPNLRETQRAVEETGAQCFPLLVMAIEHDRPGPALQNSY